MYSFPSFTTKRHTIYTYFFVHNLGKRINYIFIYNIRILHIKVNLSFNTVSAVVYDSILRFFINVYVEMSFDWIILMFQCYFTFSSDGLHSVVKLYTWSVNFPISYTRLFHFWCSIRLKDLIWYDPVYSLPKSQLLTDDQGILVAMVRSSLIFMQNK